MPGPLSVHGMVTGCLQGVYRILDGCRNPAGCMSSGVVEKLTNVIDV